MKTSRLLFVLLGFLSLLNIMGCKKDLLPEDDFFNSSEEFYIKFKSDGELVVFANDNVNSILIGTFSEMANNSTDQYGSGINGTRDLNGENKYFSIFIGTLEETQLNTTYTNYTTGGSKIQADNFISTYIIGEEVFGSVDEVFYELTGIGVPDTQILFTEVSEKTIKGTFSGTWTNFQSDNNISIKITEGEFYIPRIRNN